MEILFENSHVRNKELAKEVYGYYYFKRKIMVALYIILTLSFVDSLLIWIFEGMFGVALVLVPAYFLFVIYLYLNRVNQMVKMDAESFGKEVTVSITVTEDHLEHTASTGGVAKTEITNVKKVIVTKNLILLHTKANLIYIFRKDSFAKGTEAEFMAFLKYKGFKVRV